MSDMAGELGLSGLDRSGQNRLQGLKAAVPQDEPRGELVTVVVKVEVVELCFGHGVRSQAIKQRPA